MTITAPNTARPSDDLPAPSYAFGVSGWEWRDTGEGDGGWQRAFTLREWRVVWGRAWADVAVDGTEYLDGRLDIGIFTQLHDRLTVDDTRAVAAALIEAADFLNEYNDKTGGTNTNQ